MRKSVLPFTFSALCDLPETSEKKIQKKIRKFFSSIFSFLRAFVVSSCRKSGFRVFLSLRYGADLGRSRLVFIFFPVDNLTLTLFLQFVHLSYLFIFDQAGERGFDSRTKP